MVQTKEEISAKRKAYRAANKAQIAAQGKAYRAANKEKITATHKAYYEANKEKVITQHSAYSQTPDGIKCGRVSSWKFKGLTPPTGMTLHELYDTIYVVCTHCMVCKTEFKNITDRCADHDHDKIENNFRQVLCMKCNVNDNWLKHI